MRAVSALLRGGVGGVHADRPRIAFTIRSTFAQPIDHFMPWKRPRR